LGTAGWQTWQSFDRIIAAQAIANDVPVNAAVLRNPELISIVKGGV